MAYSRVNEGLRGLAKVSNAVLNGNTSAVPQIFRNFGQKTIRGTAPSIKAGANAVLGTVGINPNLLAPFGLNTNSIVNSGIATAENVFTEVTKGNFTSAGIGAAQAPLEALEAFLNNQPSATSNETIDDRVKAYAVDRAYSSIHPKFKFLYVIQFEFSKNFTSLKDDANFMAFAVRSASRPTVTVDYEDVNMYNFRTKVPKFSEYQPATMTFYDDQSNKTTSFYKKYIEALIPNAQMPQGTQDLYETNSFNFDSRSGTTFNSSSLQALPTLAGQSGDNNIIKSIKLFHIWNWGQSLNIYHYFNPKISEINIGDLDMDSQEVSEIEIQFSYDGLYIETVSNRNDNKPISLDPASEDSNNYDITKLTTLPGLQTPHPIQYNGKGLPPSTPLGNTTSVPRNLKEPVLDNLDTSKLTNGGKFPDMEKLLEVGLQAADQLNGNGSILEKFQGTYASARNAFGDAIPNVNDIAALFKGKPKPVPPPTEAQLAGDFTNKSTPDSEFR